MLPVPERRLALALLGAGVLLAHVWIGDWIAEGAVALGEGSAAAGPARMKAVFVADLKPAAPPATVERAAAPRRARVATQPLAPTKAASAPPEPAASAPEVRRPEPEQVASSESPAPALSASSAALEPEVQAASAPPPELVASAPPAVPLATAASSFEWPRSTRLSYRLTGQYRGPVDGQASVEWLREGSRYQVHLEVSIGPSFAPLVSRRMSSDGEIVPDGLAPRRYEEETRVALRSPRRVLVSFDGPTLRLANGSEVPRPAGVQDTASQFVQLTWLFTTQPHRLRSGQSVDLMLALPRRVDAWVYDVLEPERLQTPAGPIDAVHVRPRRPARPSGELTAEAWFAPTLQYLPVRIVIRQDAETFVDLLLERLPQQAAEPVPR